MRTERVGFFSLVLALACAGPQPLPQAPSLPVPPARAAPPEAPAEARPAPPEVPEEARGGAVNPHEGAMDGFEEGEVPAAAVVAWENGRLCAQYCDRASQCTSEFEMGDCLMACEEEVETSRPRIECGSVEDCDLFTKCVMEM
jgi:hypothetical protein